MEVRSLILRCLVDFYFCWANDRKMPLALQIDRRKQLLKIPLLGGFSLAVGELSGRLCAGTRAMLEANQSVVGNVVSLYFTPRVCLRWWEGVSKMNPMNPKAISVHHCRFSSQVTLASSRSWDCVRPCSPPTQSVLKLEATFELGGLSGKDFSMPDKAGSIGKGQQAGRTSELSGMDVSPAP